MPENNAPNQQTVSARPKRSYRLSDAGRKSLQAAAAHSRPWLQSTGPKTTAGAARSAMNAFVHGERSAEVIERQRRIRDLLRYVRDLKSSGSMPARTDLSPAGDEHSSSPSSPGNAVTDANVVNIAEAGNPSSFVGFQDGAGSSNTPTRITSLT
jgi:hypothetical protein